MVGNQIETQEIVEKEHFTEAPITIIAADQRQGKSTTAVGKVVEDALAHIVAIKPPPYTTEMKVEPLNEDDIDVEKAVDGRIVRFVRGTSIKYTTDIVKSAIPNKKSRIIRIQPTDDNLRPLPESEGGRYPIIIPSINIYTNFHLYGIRYTYSTPAQILERLHNDTMRDGWLIIDQAENLIGSRHGATVLAKTMIDYSHQFGKRHLHTILIYPHLHIADWIQRYQRTETISCECDKRTHIITLHIRKSGDKGEIVYDYNGDVYWRFFDTDEPFKQPDSRVFKAIAQAW